MPLRRIGSAILICIVLVLVLILFTKPNCFAGTERLTLTGWECVQR
jgi:hypothetical protein